MVSERERRMVVLGPHVFDGVPLARAAADAGVPRRTAARWLLAYTADGSTARSGRSDRARRRRTPVELVNLIEGMALRRPPPKIAQVHREAVRIAEERGWPAPSYPVVYRIITGLDRGLVSLAQRGDAGYRNDFDLVLRRESTNANDLWQADHTQLDVMVLDESDRPVRPWLTVILDDKSRASRTAAAPAAAFVQLNVRIDLDVQLDLERIMAREGLSKVGAVTLAIRQAAGRTAGE